MNYPNKHEFQSFWYSIKATCESNQSPRSAKYQTYYWASNMYEEVTLRFSQVETFIYSNNQNYKRHVGRFFIFLCLKLQLTVPYDDLKSIDIRQAKQISNYFQLITPSLRNRIQEELKTKSAQNSFYSCVIRFCICTTLKKLDDLTLQKIDEFKRTSLNSDTFYNIGFFSILRRAFSQKKLPTKYMMERLNTNSALYGTEAVSWVVLIQGFLQESYALRGYNSTTVRPHIKAFFMWLENEQSKELTPITLSKDIWYQYKHEIELSKLSLHTKDCRINILLRFFEWMYRNDYIREENLLEEYGYRWSNHKRGSSRPKMFKVRKHYLMIFTELLKFHPETELEMLCKHFTLLNMAIGARMSDIMWLGPHCVVCIQDGIGEIYFSSKDKLGLVNKPMTCMPWGLESIQILEKRWEQGKKTKFFHKASGKELYSLFEYQDRLISKKALYDFFKKLIEKTNILDENGQVLDYKHIRFHAFRHQKFNDIYMVTNGSLTAVQYESNHYSILMVKQYTKQEMEQRRKDSLKAIEDGKIVGKGAEILHALLASPFAPKQYLEIIKKLDMASRITKETAMKSVKDLGFGFCASPHCIIAPMCETCDCFFTCSTYIEELKERYANNFLLIQKIIALVGNNTFFLETNRYHHLVIGLKFQEKWLKELHVSNQEIWDLKCKYVKE